MSDDVTQLVIETPLFVIRERVHKGATLLDNIEAGWAPRVNLGTLESSCAVHGILGQVFGLSEDDDSDAFGAAIGRTGLLMSEEEQAYWRATDPEGYQIVDHDTEQLVGHGFFVREREMREIPEILRTMYKFATGKEAPERAPMPRDRGQVELEEMALLECWRDEVRSRL